jgi:hypothetical protein
MYKYKKENRERVNLEYSNKQNRTEEVCNIQRYLKSVKYRNRNPIADRSIVSSAATKLALQDWMFEVVFDYSEHDLRNPKLYEEPGQVWKCRRDPFSSFKSGFEVCTYRLCQCILMFHHFPEELGQQDYLVKALEIEYDKGLVMTYLKHVQQAAFVLYSTNNPPLTESDKGYLYFVKRFLPIVLEYTQLPTEEELQNLTLQELDDDAGFENVPQGVQGQYQ